MVPGLLPPRLWELNSLAIEEGFRCLFVALGAEVSELDRPHALLVRIRGRAALDFDAMASAVRLVPGRSSQELEREYLGQVSQREPPSQSTGGGAMQAVRLARARLSVTQEAATMTRTAERLVEAEPRLTQLSDRGLLAYRARVVQIAVRTMAAEIAVAARLAQSEVGRAFHDDVVAALAQVGSASVCGGTTWVEAAPTAWRALVAARVERDDSVGDDDLPGGRWLRREARAATEMLAGRERAKGAVMTGGGLVWRVDREVARRLDAEDRIEMADDIDLLLGREMRDLLEGRGPTPADIARRRRLLAEHGLDRSLPRVFRGSPTTTRRRPVMVEEFTGWGASAGRFEGPARIVRSAGGDGLQRGEVLVARRTDASWAPLFLIAGAVVIEEGGPLSHASIVSRELGLPRVVPTAMAPSPVPASSAWSR